MLECTTSSSAKSSGDWFTHIAATRYDPSVSSTIESLQVDPKSSVPIHEQVASVLRRAIADEEAKPGERLLEFSRGRGVSVTGVAPNRSVILEKARELTKLAQHLGYRPDELLKIVKQVS